MAGKNTAVFGIFRSRASAEQAVDELIVAGYRTSEVSILAPDQKAAELIAAKAFMLVAAQAADRSGAGIG